jgi:hypothetical protein
MLSPSERSGTAVSDALKRQAQEGGLAEREQLSHGKSVQVYQHYGRVSHDLVKRQHVLDRRGPRPN